MKIISFFSTAVANTGTRLCLAQEICPPSSPPALFGAVCRVRALNFVLNSIDFHSPEVLDLTFCLPERVKMFVWGEEGTEKLHLAWKNKNNKKTPNNKHSSISSIKRYVWVKLKKIKYCLLQEKKSILESTELCISNQNFSELQIQGKACDLDQNLINISLPRSVPCIPVKLISFLSTNVNRAQLLLCTA